MYILEKFVPIVNTLWYIHCTQPWTFFTDRERNTGLHGTHTQIHIVQPQGTCNKLSIEFMEVMLLCYLCGIGCVLCTNHMRNMYQVGHCRHPGISRQAVDLMRGIKIDTLIDHTKYSTKTVGYKGLLKNYYDKKNSVLLTPRPFLSLYLGHSMSFCKRMRKARQIKLRGTLLMEHMYLFWGQQLVSIPISFS